MGTSQSCDPGHCECTGHSPGQGNCRITGRENSECTCDVLGRHMHGTLSISLQCTCDVLAWNTDPCPQCLNNEAKALHCKDDEAKLRAELWGEPCMSFFTHFGYLRCSSTIPVTSNILSCPPSPELACSPSPHVVLIPTQPPKTSPSPNSANDNPTPSTKKTHSKTAGKTKTTTGAIGNNAEGGTNTRGRSQRKH